MKKEPDRRSATRSQTYIRTSQHPLATKQEKTEANKDRYRRIDRDGLDEQMALRDQRHHALVLMLMGIRVKKMMKLFRRRQTQQAEPKTQHQDADGDPAEPANAR